MALAERIVNNVLSNKAGKKSSTRYYAYKYNISVQGQRAEYELFVFSKPINSLTQFHNSRPTWHYPDERLDVALQDAKEKFNIVHVGTLN